MNNTAFSDNTQDTDDLGGGTTLGGFGYGIGLSIGVLVVFVVITYFSYKCKTQSQSRPSSALPRRHTFPDEYAGSVHVVIHRDDGLDAAIISNFPLYTYAQLKPHKGGASGCAVCLGDYKDSEAVRLLPECGHVFHRSCIDPWLMIHPTCPICRNSPLKAAEAATTRLAEPQPAPAANQ